MAATTGEKEGILSILSRRPIIGDGSYVITLEKRGYVRAGPFTPEATVENPDAVRQLHRDFLRAGSDVLQAFSFYASSGKLKGAHDDKVITSEDLNEAACRLVQEVAATKPGTLICGGLSPTPSYSAKKGEKAVKDEFRTQINIFANRQVDFLLAEFFGSVEEAVWAIETMKEADLPVACTMRMGPTGDVRGVPAGECAIRMARAGADILGLNCQYDPDTCIKTIKMMKTALDEAGLSPFLMVQPVGFHVPEVENLKNGYHDLPEFPFCMEPRLLTRFDCRRFAREAYEAGVSYLGGCCGFEPYHIREMAAELAEERGQMMPGSDCFSHFGESLKKSAFPNLRTRTGREYYEKLKPASGRPFCPCLATVTPTAAPEAQ